MQVLAVFLVAALAVANAGVFRTPSLDSAVIKSDRLGGNFAYSSVEGHAYAAVSPVVSHVTSPVAVSYSATPIAAPIAAPITTYGAHIAPYASYAAPLAAAPLAYSTGAYSPYYV